MNWFDWTIVAGLVVYLVWRFWINGGSFPYCTPQDPCFYLEERFEERVKFDTTRYHDLGRRLDVTNKALSDAIFSHGELRRYSQERDADLVGRIASLEASRTAAARLSAQEMVAVEARVTATEASIQENAEMWDALSVLFESRRKQTDTSTETSSQESP